MKGLRIMTSLILKKEMKNNLKSSVYIADFRHWSIYVCSMTNIESRTGRKIILKVLALG